MKIYRTTSFSLKATSKEKLATLSDIQTEYTRLVNYFIPKFWGQKAGAVKISKEFLWAPGSWGTYRLRHAAALDALNTVSAAKAKGVKRMPTRKNEHMVVSWHIANLAPAKHAKHFDYWLHVRCVGKKIGLDLPLKSHRHDKKLKGLGKLKTRITISGGKVYVVYQIETGPKKKPEKCLGLDAGVVCAITTSDGDRIGADLGDFVRRVMRKPKGSEGQKRSARALRQQIDAACRQVCKKADLLAIEKLVGMRNTKTGGRHLRRVLSVWPYRYWSRRLELTCEENRVSFRTVPAHYTSRRCHTCGHTEKGNRNGERFLCRACGHTEHADINAAQNILHRYLTGPYGAGCKAGNRSNGNDLSVTRRNPAQPEVMYYA